ncbi:MAG: hypothetical protein JXB49_18640 [Bacteroidales bacterium]|nr:hypothetical protein [Bacteroidales bacterium]
MPEANNTRTVDHIEFSSKVSTKYLSHFTPKFDSLLKIVETGFRPSECDEFQIHKKDFMEVEAIKTWYSALAGGEENIETFTHKVPMVCFCDIPHKLANRHRKEYGMYCLAMKKKWAIAKGLSPIIYIPEESKVHVVLRTIDSLKNRLAGIGQEKDIPQILQINTQLELLFEFIKPYINKKDNYKFYDEREWRYTPPSYTTYDSKDISQYLKFNKEDFEFAIVKNAREKDLLLKALTDKFGYISSKRIKIKK